MYSQCPECRTIFKVSRAQLQARQGVVRCGSCAAVFNGKRNLVKTLPKQRTGQPAHETSVTSGADSAPIAARSRSDTDRETGTTQTDARARKNRADSGIPTVTELGPWAKPRPRTRPVFWFLGIVTLLAVFLGQVTFYFRNEIARHHELKPVVLEFCRLLDCEVEPQRRVGLIELTYATIAPHPRYENILRIHASMVNRADFSQPYPLMEVSLTDNSGRVIARRAFEHREYLDAPGAVDGVLSPNLSVNMLLDVTNPDGNAVGYEIQLVAP